MRLSWLRFIHPIQVEGLIQAPVIPQMAQLWEQVGLTGDAALSIADASHLLGCDETIAECCIYGCPETADLSTVLEVLKLPHVYDAAPVWYGKQLYGQWLAKVQETVAGRVPNGSGYSYELLHGLLQYIRLRPERLAERLTVDQSSEAAAAKQVLSIGHEWGWGASRAAASALYCLMAESYAVGRFMALDAKH